MPSASTARKSGHSPTSRSSWSPISRAGRHRHRERAAAQRAARIAAAADRHRRRAQGHQPLDLRSAGGARHAGRIGGPAVRGRHGAFIVQREGTAYRSVASYGFSREYRAVHGDFIRFRRGADRWSGGPCWKAEPSIFPTSWPIRNTPWPRPQSSVDSAPCWASRCCERERPIGRDRCQRHTVRAIHRQADRAGRRPLPTRR